MLKEITGHIVIYQTEDGKFETSLQVLADHDNALRSIYMFEGRNFIDIVPVTFKYDPDAPKISGMEHKCNEKLQGRPPCPPMDE